MTVYKGKDKQNSIKCKYLQHKNGGKVPFFVSMKPRRPKRTDKILTDMIIQRMKELRESHGYPQEYVHENTDKLDIAHFENGAYVPSVISLSILCKFYNITLDEFFAPLNYPPKK